jgi:hypothetical protein
MIMQSSAVVYRFQQVHRLRLVFHNSGLSDKVRDEIFPIKQGLLK